MITKDDLLRYKYIKSEIESLKADINELENISVGVASYSEMISNGMKNSKIESSMEKIFTLREMYYKRLYTVLELKIRIEDEVAKLPYNERMVLREYYLNGLNWYEVSEKLFISLSWCHKLHNRALKMLSVH